MELSIWTYPWDIQDIGLSTVERELRERAGLNTISLATSYLAGRFLQPRSPRRKSCFPEDGTSYFKTDASRWEGSAIKPKVADVILEGGDVLGELVSRRDAGGLGVSCWTVCLHNTKAPAEFWRHQRGWNFAERRAAFAKRHVVGDEVSALSHPGGWNGSLDLQDAATGRAGIEQRDRGRGSAR